ncbi:serine hydrolase domain-containing protein [Heyndrickxia sp. NPDC080065]|uniref:serine hydrolase domain-containing protein n=1 Tax=Heyndrickxia sp. NPDC080065 TaxID=3390568 RepID=UPI003CFE1128
MKSELLNQLEQEIKKVKIASCLIHHENEMVFQYFKNKKMENKLFQMHSVTKSVISILMGIAIDKGKIDSIKAPISNYLSNVPEDKRNITMEHLLTMTPGYEWGEFGEWGGRPFPMINSKNWVKFVLEKNMETEPGMKMAYNSGASHLLSAILQKAANDKSSAYAEKELFKPLGITDYRWYEDSKGISIGGFGLCLKSKDMLKIGIMMLERGGWSNKQLVSDEWVSSSTTAKYHTYDHIGSYGYHWWVLTDESPNIFFAMGFGGQYIIVSPSHKLVVVFTSELYNDTFFPLHIFRKHILQAIELSR